MTTSKTEKALKARQTKLNKKSKEALIDIILKKDKIYKNLTCQINKLKDINKLLRIDNETVVNKNTKLNNINIDYKRNIDFLNDLIKDKNSVIKTYTDNIEKINNKLKLMYKITIFTIVLFISFLISNIF